MLGGISMKTKKIWLILSLILLIVIILFIVLTARKFIIIGDLEEKVNQQNARNNIYVKVDTSDISGEIFKKDDTIKAILNYKDSDTKVIQVASGTTRTVYTESNAESDAEDSADSNTEKKAYVNENETLNTNVISNAVATDGFWSKLNFSLLSHITTELLEDTEYYVLENKHNSNFMLPVNCDNLKVYIEKETGLIWKEVLIFEDGTEETTTYEYSFDTVTDDDIQVPDITEYEVQE